MTFGDLQSNVFLTKVEPSFHTGIQTEMIRPPGPLRKIEGVSFGESNQSNASPPTGYRRHGSNPQQQRLASFGNRRDASQAERVAKAAPPEIVVGRINGAAQVAVGGEIGLRSEIFSPDNVVGRVDHAVQVVIAGQAADIDQLAPARYWDYESKSTQIAARPSSIRAHRRTCRPHRRRP